LMKMATPCAPRKEGLADKTSFEIILKWAWRDSSNFTKLRLTYRKGGAADGEL